MNRITTAQTDNVDKGSLQINVISDVTSYPISEAKISITYTGVPESPIEELTTDSSGQTELLELDTPPLEYSLNPSIEYQPYSEYTLNVSAPGFEPLSISGTEILPDVTAIQNITMRPLSNLQEITPPKIIMSNIKIISKMSLPAKSMLPGHRIQFGQMCSRLCHLH